MVTALTHQQIDLLLDCARMVLSTEMVGSATALNRQRLLQ
jgi:hypothetical protein